MNHKPTILIVEDEPMLRTAYELILKTHGYRVLTAPDGQAGLKLLAAERPSLVLLDLLMPIVDGKKFLKQARPATNYPRTKIIVYSNLYDEQTGQQVTGLGAHRYVLKSSLSPAQLVAMIEDVLTETAAQT